MAKKIKALSVFFPAYNVETLISKTLERAFKVVPQVAETYEIIVIDDGSTDGTGGVLGKFKKKHPELKVITHRKNRGYGGAIKSGLYGAKHAWIAYTDGDGQFDISEITKLTGKQEQTNADLVIGYYLKRQVSTFVIFTSRLWELVVNILFGLKVTDVDCGFKLIRKKVIDTIPKLESERGAFISSELLIKAKSVGFKIAEVGVSHHPRKEDKKSVTGRDLNVIVKSFTDLIKLWKKLQ